MLCSGILFTGCYVQGQCVRNVMFRDIVYGTLYSGTLCKRRFVQGHCVRDDPMFPRDLHDGPAAADQHRRHVSHGAVRHSGTRTTYFNSLKLF
jgi:hypothetical protein